MSDDTTIPPIKRCTKCGEIKPLEMFHRDRHTRDGVSTRCKVCACQRRNQYHATNRDQCNQKSKAYRESHPEKMRQLNAQYYAENRDFIIEQRREYMKLYYQANRERLLQYKREWQYINRERIGEAKRIYHTQNRERIIARVKAWAMANPERKKISRQRWVAANPEKVKAATRASVHRRRARKAGNGGSYTREEMFALQEAQNGHCAYCNRTGYALHIEHIVPIVQGGPSYIWNICLACRKCNLNKGPKTPEQWIDRWYLRC